MRASYLRVLLTRSDEFGPAAQDVRKRLGDAHLTSIECAGPLVWLPVAADLALQRALAEILGAERTREFALASLRELWAGSLLQPLLITAVGIFGLHPGSFAKLVPAAWGLLYRDCGRWTVGEARPVAQIVGHGEAQGTRDRREVELHLRDLPPACADEPAWIGAVETVLHAVLILCDVDERGEVEIVDRDPRSGAACFRLSW